tara:strand:+ start:363 stop:1220 length:858 start_codon:yes stop_codon:yes gene_type:complete
MKKIAFVSDFFASEVNGGAELTTNAIMSFGYQMGHHIVGIKCSSINVEMLKNEKDNFHFIICNFKSLDNDIKLYMCKNVSYSIIEYDYKICEYRSVDLHINQEGTPCDCETRNSGKINSAFYGYADKVWFMSNRQKEIILSKVAVLKEENCEVLNSVFSYGDLRFIHSLKDNEKNNSYLIMSSDSWIKNTEKTIEYAKDNKLEFELVGGLPYHELLIKMSTSKGLIFQPIGADTCPRLVMEAKMLGCDLIINENVQHKDESWFKTQDSCYAHMDTRGEAFWSYYE